MKSWVETGKQAKPCLCIKDSVKINMNNFLNNLKVSKPSDETCKFKIKIVLVKSKNKLIIKSYKSSPNTTKKEKNKQKIKSIKKQKNERKITKKISNKVKDRRQKNKKSQKTIKKKKIESQKENNNNSIARVSRRLKHSNKK